MRIPFHDPFLRRRSRNSSASRAVEMGSGASRSGGHAPFAKPKWLDPCAFLVTPPFFLRLGRNPLLSRRRCGLAFPFFFFSICRLCLHMLLCCVAYLGTGLRRAAMLSMGTREGRKKGQEPARRLRATLNPKRVVFGWPWGGLVRNVMACAMGKAALKNDR